MVVGAESREETASEVGAGSASDRDWQFARRPFWIFSHFFALSVVSLFIFLGFWQLNRLDERRETNALVESRIEQPIELISAPDGGADGADLDYRAVTATVQYLDPDFVRIGNRSQGGAAGLHVVAIAELPDGSPLAISRGFVPSNADVELQPLPSGPVEISGWLRKSVQRESIGAIDTGEGTVLPRFDTERIAARLDRPLPNVWLQLAPDEQAGLVTFPNPVPLPPIDEGPHLSYAAQWFIFATLGVLFYLALLRRQSKGNEAAPIAPPPL
ncbi:MAG: SURF1 family protein [Acidimicrobiales bacterium]